MSRSKNTQLKTLKKQWINHEKLILFTVQKNESFSQSNVKNSQRHFWRFSHSLFFVLEKFTADFKDDVPHGNASAKCTGNYCLRMSIESFFRFVKSLPRLEAFSQVIRADRLTLGNSRRVPIFQQKNFITVHGYV